MPSRRCVRGFTLVELLVVIAVIGILASLLLPALGRGKRNAYSAVCLSNLHQIGLALDMYVHDNNNRLPICAPLPNLGTNPPLTMILSNYITAPDVFHCPDDRSVFNTSKCSYEWNAFLNGVPYDRPQDWSLATKAIVETVFGGRAYTPLVGDAEPFHPASGTHLGKNALYFDGRVERSNWKK